MTRALKVIFAATIALQIAMQIGIDKGFALSGEELLQSCEAALRQAKTLDSGKYWVPNEGMVCWRYVEAIQDMSTAVDPSKCTTLPCKNPVLAVCSSSESTLMQYIRIFVLAARQNPELLHQPAAHIALAALRKAFPCKQV